MVNIALYLPKYNGADANELTRRGVRGLPDESASINWSQVLQNGPDGSAGALCWWELPGEQPFMRGELLGGGFEWFPSKPIEGREAGGVWYGLRKDIADWPSALARRKIKISEPVVLADDKVWLVPIARQLPSSIGIDDEGELTQVRLPRYDTYFSRATKAMDWFLKSEEADPTWREIFDFCVEALAINYQVNADVLSRLRIVTTENAILVAKAAVELDALLEAFSRESKKNDMNGVEQPTFAGAPG